MKKLVQNTLLGMYRVVNASGALRTRAGRRIFEWGYHGYKRMLEAGDIQALTQWIKPGTVVIDVGANIGFFTRYFARRVSDGGKVLAIEPEQNNFKRLTEMLRKSRLNGNVETFEAVAAEQSGELKLVINPLHPADHKIWQDGVTVNAVSLDELAAARQWQPVSLIKVDVQGAEMLVLKGSLKILERFRPVLYLEVDDEGLRRMNSSAEELFRTVQKLGYSLHRII